jgi:thymidine phosphorylase
MVLGGLSNDVEAASRAVRDTLTDGSAAERFGQMVTALGGPADFVDHWRDRLPSAPVVRDVTAPHSGFVTAMDGHALGMAVVHMGGGRTKGGERIDPAVGLSNVCELGEPVDRDVLIATIHARSLEDADIAQAALLRAISIGDTAPAQTKLILEKVSA